MPAQGADHPLNDWQRARALTATYRVDIFGHMDTKRVMANFAALSQETRLETFRLLVRHEPKGLAAGEIARRLGVPHNTLSSHLSVLVSAGLAVSQRQSRSIIYRANLDHMKEIIQFLVRDCCAGHPQMHEPLVASLVGCSPINKKK